MSLRTAILTSLAENLLEGKDAQADLAALLDLNIEAVENDEPGQPYVWGGELPLVALLARAFVGSMSMVAARPIPGVATIQFRDDQGEVGGSVDVDIPVGLRDATDSDWPMNEGATLSAAQVRTAQALAARLGHDWGKRPLPVAENYTVGQIRRHTYDTVQPGNIGHYGIMAPTVSEAGDITHVTGSGRVRYAVRPDGTLSVVVSRPGSWIAAASQYESVIVISGTVFPNGEFSVKLVPADMAVHERHIVPLAEVVATAVAHHGGDAEEAHEACYRLQHVPQAVDVSYGADLPATGPGWYCGWSYGDSVVRSWTVVDRDGGRAVFRDEDTAGRAYLFVLAGRSVAAAQIAARRRHCVSPRELDTDTWLDQIQQGLEAVA